MILLPVRRPHSFTLIELLVAMAVAVLILTLLFQVFAATTRQWRRADQRIDTFRDARAALQMITQDLRHAAVYASPPMLVLAEDPTDDPRTDSRNQEAYVVTAISNNGKSNLCTVGYYCVWDTSHNAFILKRLFKDSDATFANLRNAYAAHNPLVFSDLFSRSNLTAAHEAEDNVGSYIWNLTFAPGGQPDGGTLAYPQTYPAPTAPASAKWKWIEVRFKALSPALGQKLATLGVTRDIWFDSSSRVYQNVILPDEQQFVTRVMLDAVQ